MSDVRVITDIVLSYAENGFAKFKRLTSFHEIVADEVNLSEHISQCLCLELGPVSASPGILTFHFPEQTTVIGGVVLTLGTFTTTTSFKILVSLIVALIP